MSIYYYYYYYYRKIGLLHITITCYYYNIPGMQFSVDIKTQYISWCDTNSRAYWCYYYYTLIWHFGILHLGVCRGCVVTETLYQNIFDSYQKHFDDLPLLNEFIIARLLQVHVISFIEQSSNKHVPGKFRWLAYVHRREIWRNPHLLVGKRRYFFDSETRSLEIP